MKRHLRTAATLIFLASLFLSACQVGGILPVGKRVVVTMVYGSEKQAWLEPLVADYNEQRNRTEEGSVIVIEATPMGSIESGDAIVEGRIQPIVWSPASSAYVPVTDTKWRQMHGEDLTLETPNDLVLSPVVIAMWRPMAEALGWPEETLGWSDIAELAVSEDGWAGYGYPEWGTFKFGHTAPNRSNSGIISVIAEAYAGAGKQRDLTMEDLQDADVIAFMTAVESSIIHYGSSTGFFATRMFERGPSYLSAAVMYENLVAEQEAKRLSGESNQLPVVAIYPKEGTFWSNHPYIVLNAPWVSEEQREAAEMFEAFLLAEPQQIQSIAYGFRPADPGVPLTSPLDLQHGVDPKQPQTVLEVPEGEVVEGILNVWRSQVKKPVDLVVVMDISGSMEGEKINAARASLIEFINLLDDRDRLQIILFSDELITLTPLSPLREKRADVLRRVAGVIEGGDTRFYDAVQLAYDELAANGDRDHIRAIVALTDGNDTASTLNLDQLMVSVGNLSEGGNATKVFTIAFGSNADERVLVEIAETTGARQYDSDPDTIRDVYAEIATFF
ncbi:MAG: VWA domain-containing protein [Anaerolineae bacterium]|nr:VWA domain-containing protein [Anaerolineae bacterium]